MRLWHSRRFAVTIVGGAGPKITGTAGSSDMQDEEIVDGNDNSGGLVVLAVDDEHPALEELAYLLGEDSRVGPCSRPPTPRTPCAS